MEFTECLSLTVSCVVHAVQVKTRLKLIATMSLNVTSHICVLSVANSLQQKCLWELIENHTLAKTGVKSARNGFRLVTRCTVIWIFTEVVTSAENVANVVQIPVVLQYTDSVIQERNRLNVLFVANDLQRHVTLLCTAEFTVERNHIHVMNVRNVFHLRDRWLGMWISIQVNTSAPSVTNVL